MSAFFATLPGFTAAGDIYGARFVVGSGVRTVVQAANATTRLWGVVKDFTRYAPGSPADDGKHAVSGESVSLIPPGAIAALILGSGGATAHNSLVSDTAGKGIVAATTGTVLEYVGAIALQTGVAGDKIEVWTVESYTRRAALS